MSELSNDTLTPKEITEIYKVSLTTLWRLEKSGELEPCMKTKGAKGKTGRRYYLRRAVEAFFAGEEFSRA